MTLKLEVPTEGNERGNDEYSSIKSVIFVMCLICPGALGNRADYSIIWRSNPYKNTANSSQ